MRGVGVVEFGGPGMLRVVDLPEVHAGAGQVRIRVHAASVNPTDTSTRNGTRAVALREIPPPYIPGMDGAGVIDEIGPGTDTDLAPWRRRDGDGHSEREPRRLPREHRALRRLGRARTNERIARRSGHPTDERTDSAAVPRPARTRTRPDHRRHRRGRMLRRLRRAARESRGAARRCRCVECRRTPGCRFSVPTSSYPAGTTSRCRYERWPPTVSTAWPTEPFRGN